jgi:hypothetical protein
MLASVRYVDLGRVGETPPDRRPGAERFSRQPGPVVEADLDSQGDSGPRISGPPFVDPLSVPRSTSPSRQQPHRLIPAATARAATVRGCTR